MTSSLSQRDRDLVIRTMIGEAGNQGPQGQAAVAHVILNRLAAGKYGNTASDVVLAPHQFEPWQTRSKELMGYDPKGSAYQNAGDILDMTEGGDIPDRTNGATHFLNANIVKQRTGGSLPSWASKPIAQIGDHTFYAPEGKVAPNVADIDPLDAINRSISDPN
jgi:spore germination cell wall hydrolase CwlJ-like protein